MLPNPAFSASSVSRIAIESHPGVRLDARRAVWLEESSTLAVADLHLGYAWAHRHSGQLLPLSAPDTSLARLHALIAEYQPRQLAVLGDIVHRAVPVEALEADLLRLCEDLGAQTSLRLISGNHDRALAGLLQRCGIAVGLDHAIAVRPHLLLHGESQDETEAAQLTAEARTRGGQIFMGHEHPAIRVGDGVTSVKCPCFLSSPQLIVLPAFSEWSAGSPVRSGGFMSALANGAKFGTAYAILAGKLLPLRL